MIRTIALIKANLKGFMRNWRSIFLLVIFPMLLIGLVFSSFSPEGLNRVSAGVIVSSPESKMLVQGLDFLDVTEYGKLEHCLGELEKYHTYVCIDTKASDVLTLEIYYDNTRDPVIWEIIEKIKAAADIVQEQKSQQIAQDMLGGFSQIGTRIDLFKSSLQDVSTVLDTYAVKTDNSIIKLTQTRNDLSTELTSMEQDLADIKSSKAMLQSNKDSYYRTSTGSLNDVVSQAESLNVTTYPETYYVSSIIAQAKSAKSQLNAYNTEADQEFSSIDNKIQRYEYSCQ
ncbi:MAG: hypothetical protein HGA85_06365, partial [Nanoarchaeota archaeon]|nr:hypothetical protein [Nanoarchaeota archaeon]